MTISQIRAVPLYAAPDGWQVIKAALPVMSYRRVGWFCLSGFRQFAGGTNCRPYRLAGHGRVSRRSLIRNAGKLARLPGSLNPKSGV